MCGEEHVDHKCCCCPLRVGLRIYWVFLIVATISCFFDLSGSIFNLVMNLIKLITLSLAIFSCRKETIITMAKWNFIFHVFVTVLSLPLNLLGLVFRHETFVDI